MKASAWCLAATVTLASALSSAAHADPMLSGQISLVGRGSVTGSAVIFSDLDLATEQTSSDSFQNLFSSALPLDVVQLRSFTNEDVSRTPGGFHLFQVQAPGSDGDFLMNLTSVTEGSCGTDEVCVNGTGSLEEQGSVQTPATFNLETREGRRATFSAIASTSPTPEPSSLLLLGTGLLGTAAALYRRKRFGTPS